MSKVNLDQQVTTKYAEMEQVVMNDGKPPLDTETIRQAHEYFEFIAEDDLQVDAWFHAQLKKSLKQKASK